MRGSTSGRSFAPPTALPMALPMALLLALGTLFTLGAARSPAAAAVTIGCAPATPAALAAPAAPATSAAATPVTFPVGGGELTVFAAASLTESFGEIKSTLEAANSRLTITFNFAGSPALVTQLSQGAKADVVALASRHQMDSAVEQGVIDGKPANFAQSRLVLIVSKGNPAGIDGPVDLAKGGLKIVLAQPEVPVGQYARESVCAMGRDTATFGAGFVEKVAANVVSDNEDNVKAIVTKVRSGEADAGFVYATDVTKDVARDVQTIEVPTQVNVIATYPIAKVKGGNRTLAQAFIDDVLGPHGQAILRQHHFEPKP